jgi:valyl-tRNA synthetase
VKITPAHDFNDFQVGARHGLEPISIFTLEARVNENAPLAYQGLDRFEARKRVLADLEKRGLVEGGKPKPHKMTVPRSQRTDAIVEPMLSDQWFVRMEGMAKKGLDTVAKGETRFVPPEWTKIYDQWLGNIQDWCISRQLWWGHQIPAWYAEDGTAFVGRTFEEAQKHATAAGKRISPESRDPDVLDTWFSSALVPFTTLGWPDEKEFERERRFYLPSTVLVTGFDIIFFWVARMIMTSLQFTGVTAFRDVYINAIVRDAEGQKMSKSKGNTIDPLDVIDGIGFDALLEKSTQGLMLAAHKETAAKRIKREFPTGIEAYGADALRFTFASLSTLGRTLNFDLKRCEGYRSFCNKLWNATRFVLMNTEGKDTGLDESKPVELSVADRWIVSRLQRAEQAVTSALDEYRFDVAARTVYELVYEYCDWYVEITKTQLAHGNDAQQRATRRTLMRVLETMLRLAHPFIPFITEELWQKVAPLAGKTGESIMVAPFPKPESAKIDETAEAEVALWQAQVEASRNLKASNHIGPNEKVALYAQPKQKHADWQHAPWIALARLSEIRIGEVPAGTPAASTATSNGTLAIVLPQIDKAAERGRLGKKIAELEAEIEKARLKLDDSSFVAKAPAHIVDQMKKRLADFEAKHSDMRSQLGKLG